MIWFPTLTSQRESFGTTRKILQPFHQSIGQSTHRRTDQHGTSIQTATATTRHGITHWQLDHLDDNDEATTATLLIPTQQQEPFGCLH